MPIPSPRFGTSDLDIGERSHTHANTHTHTETHIHQLKDGDQNKKIDLAYKELLADCADRSTRMTSIGRIIGEPCGHTHTHTQVGNHYVLHSIRVLTSLLESCAVHIHTNIHTHDLVARLCT